MPKNSWSDKRERQYEHIKLSELDEGKSEETAEAIAARTVNKVRAQKGEARTSSKASTHDISPDHRGGLRSHSGADGRTKAQLYEEARNRNIPGRSKMSKAQLLKALKR